MSLSTSELLVAGTLVALVDSTGQNPIQYFI